jgi:hypothetical protein
MHVINDLMLFISSLDSTSLIVSVVAIVFHLKIYQNNIFFILKKLFLTSAYQNNLKILIQSK